MTGTIIERGFTTVKKGMKRKSIMWTVCYAYPIKGEEDDFYTGSWFAMGRSKEEAKADFLRNWELDEEFCGCTVDQVSVVGIHEGFSC